MLEINIGKGKETRNEEVKGEARGSRLKILAKLSQIESSMRTLMFSSGGECHQLGLATKFVKSMCSDSDKTWHKTQA